MFPVLPMWDLNDICSLVCYGDHQLGEFWPFEGNQDLVSSILMRIPRSCIFHVDTPGSVFRGFFTLKLQSSKNLRNTFDEAGESLFSTDRRFASHCWSSRSFWSIAFQRALGYTTACYIWIIIIVMIIAITPIHYLISGWSCSYRKYQAKKQLDIVSTVSPKSFVLLVRRVFLMFTGMPSLSISASYLLKCAFKRTQLQETYYC